MGLTDHQHDTLNILRRLTLSGGAASTSAISSVEEYDVSRRPVLIALERKGLVVQYGDPRGRVANSRWELTTKGREALSQ